MRVRPPTSGCAWLSCVGGKGILVVESSPGAKKMGSDDLLVEVNTKQQSDALLKLNLVSDYKTSPDDLHLPSRSPSKPPGVAIVAPPPNRKVNSALLFNLLLRPFGAGAYLPTPLLHRGSLGECQGSRPPRASCRQLQTSPWTRLDNSRRITEAHCTCRGGTCGQCKQTAAVAAYVNREDTSTKTSITNVWKRPSAKQLGMYNKGVLFSEMFPSKLPDGRLQGQPVPASIVNSNCPLGIMLRQEEQVKENLGSLDKLLPRVGQPRVIFDADGILSEELCGDILLAVMISEDECKEIARETILQCACPQWHRERAARISASSKAYKVKIRTADFDTLAKDLASPRSFKSASCSYGVAKEPEARKEYESSEKKKVIQPWLCCSPNGLVEENGEIRLLEIKCPSRCDTKPVVDENINVDYLQYEGKELKLQESHVYYTQVQMAHQIQQPDMQSKASQMRVLSLLASSPMLEIAAVFSDSLAMAYRDKGVPCGTFAAPAGDLETKEQNKLPFLVYQEVP
ncbi:hypothetical protein HPB47_022383 [Ixodes persulcatus]|uniref:Uncharacterized protein n=1 Tax=Ixodes persulcatus TaxID=34615 RepID=A0AC60QC73_IXOPE|nr:hypothetical protein HPB47_022383 [Ixodes persulcatus]